MLYKDGVHRIQAILDEMSDWMEENDEEYLPRYRQRILI